MFTPLCAEPWQRLYEGEEASGPNVLAYWKFDPEQPASDSGADGHPLRIRGEATRFVPDERFGGALEIGAPQDEAADHREGVSTMGFIFPEAFTMEMWIQPEREQRGGVAYLIDKKYLMGDDDTSEGNKDLSWLLREASADHHYLLEAELGFGGSSERVRSRLVALPPGEWNHVAFTYDGEGGVAFYLNGELAGEATLEGRAGASLAPGSFPLVIGDRVGSRGYRFVGKIASVRISRGVVPIHPPKEIVFEPGVRRSVFERMEAEAYVPVAIVNRTRAKTTPMRLHWEGEGKKGALDVPALDKDAIWEGRLPVDTTLRPGSYTLKTSLHPEGLPVQKLAVPFAIVARELPNQMPVVLWDFIQPEGWSEVRKIGFTHAFLAIRGLGGEDSQVLGEKELRDARQRLDAAWLLGLKGLAQVSMGRDKTFSAQYPRVDPEGKSYPNLNGNFPQARERARDLGHYLGTKIADHPNLSGVLIDTEVRDSTRPSFQPVDEEAYGKAIPREVANRPRGVSWRQLAGFPKNRVIEEDHPLLAYYRWFWKDGDGWNPLHSEIHRALKEKSHARLWSWFDPATRVPALYGSGGEVDVLGQWTYTYPDPLKISLAAEELAAMASGRPGQEIMNMTQIIWYREQTAPKEAEPQVEWERKQPDANFITISPDHLEEAFWLKLGHHVSGLMYHGYGSLSGATTGVYRGTHDESRERLTRLIQTILKPLGPTLRQIPESRPDVGFLQSFASQMFAGRGSYGWGNGWEADAWLICRYAGLQPGVIYEEGVLKKGLEGYKMLVLVHCDVLSRPVVEALSAFQARGGLIVGDEFLCPAIQPDILLTSFNRNSRAPEQAKAEMLAKAAALRKEFEDVYERVVESSEPELIVRRREAGGDYLFLANDRRTFGDYLGHHRLVMEKGEPLEGTITLRRSGGVLYDLVRRQPVALESGPGESVHFKVKMNGAGGGIYLWLETAPGQLAVSAPDQAVLDQPLHLRIVRSGLRKETVVPVSVAILDPEGREAEGSGAYGMKGGEMVLPVHLASNDLPGRWKVEVIDGLDGNSSSVAFEVRGGARP